MSVIGNHPPVDENDNASVRLSSDLDDLKSDFSHLRQDVTKLLDTVLGAGKNGAVQMKKHASSAVGDAKECLTDIKDRGVESVERVGQKISEHSLMSSAVAFGVGFLLAKLLARR